MRKVEKSKWNWGDSARWDPHQYQARNGIPVMLKGLAALPPTKQHRDRVFVLLLNIFAGALIENQSSGDRFVANTGTGYAKTGG